MIWKYFYNTGSGSEPGTLFQLKKRIGHTTVGKKPKSNFDACEDFLEVVIEGHILTAALEVLEMQNIEDEPSADALGISLSDHEIFWTYIKY